MMRGRHRLLRLALMLLAGSTALSPLLTASAAEESPQPSANTAAKTVPDTASGSATLPMVTLARAEIAPLKSRAAVSGSLVPRQEVLIYPKVAGHAIAEILVDLGDHVEAGQELARLEDRTLAALRDQAEAEYQRAEAGVKQAESQIDSSEAQRTEADRSLERAKSLRRSGSGSQATLDQATAAAAAAGATAASAHDGLSVARAALAQAEASREIARLNFADSRITAPVAGVVTGRNAELGALSGGAAEPMFVLVANGEIELAAEVIETAVPKLKVGARAEINVSGLGPVAGHVRLPPAAVDPMTRLGIARVALDGDELLRPGLFASGWIVLEEREALMVPTAAVISDGAQDHVQLVRNNEVETRPVKAGLVWEGRREILDGLEPGDEVIARAGAFFRTGDHIRGILADPAGGEAAEAAKADGKAEDVSTEAKTGAKPDAKTDGTTDGAQP